MRNRYAFALFLGISLGLYANSLGGDYVFDDYATFRKDRIRAGSVLSLTGEYRPLRYLSLRLDEAVFGGALWGYHVTNVLLHAVTILLVFLVLRRLTGHVPALAGALLFATHPAHTECVAYISGRRDLLAAIFYLLGFLAWLRFNRASGRSRWPWLAAVFASYLVALSSKEVAVTLPAVCVLYDLVLQPAVARRRIPIYAVAGGLALALALWVALRSGATHVRDWHGGSLGANVAISARLLAHYAWLAVFPLRLLGDYSYDAWPLSRSLLEPRALLALAGIAAGIAVALRAWRRAPLVTFALGWFVVTLSPVLQILPFHEIAADRHIYLPSLGLCLLAGLGFGHLRARAGPRVAWAALALVLALFSVRAVIRNRDWADSRTFWQRTVEAAPRCARAHFNLGTFFAQQAKDAGNPLSRQRSFDEAARHMERAVEIKPDYIIARVNLGRVYAIQSDLAAGGAAARLKSAARDQWEEALRLAKPMGTPPTDPGQIAMFLGRYDEAIEIYGRLLRNGFRETVALAGLRICHRYLAERAMVAGRREEALPHFREALSAAERLLLLRPDDIGLLREAAELARSAGDLRRAAELDARARRLRR